jgi:hypothetical protein
MARRLAVIALLATAVSLLAGGSATAAVITPTTHSDEGGSGLGCSLREAVLAANTDTPTGGCAAGSGADTITLGAGTYTLSIPGTHSDEGDLDIAGQLTIAHGGIAPAVIDGGRLDRVIQVLAGGHLIGSGFTVRNGLTAQSGGGIRNEGTLELTDVTISGNETTASYGGGIANAGPAVMSLANVTISGNRAEGDGGGIDQGLGGWASLTNVTISRNTADSDGDAGGGGGVLVATGTATNPSGTFNLRNTLIARNRDISPPGVGHQHDCGGILISQGHNLIGNRSGCGFKPRRGDKTHVKPLLGPLANNGGPTFTHALLAHSPAINAGGRGGSRIDQRGAPRRSPDIGAYELTRCDGKVVNRVGSSGADRLVGTGRADGILGLGGTDVLLGRAGRDGLCGGGGRDKLRGQGGADVLIGGKGKDACRGGAGRDRLKSC